METHAQDAPTTEPSKPLASFSDLPNELLTKILCEEDEPKTQRTLLALRRVSRGTNEAVKRRAVEYARLPKGAGQIEEMLALTPNTFETSTRKLVLDVQNYEDNQNREWEALASLVERMKGVQAVQWIQQGPLNKNVANALSSLPRLEALDVVLLKNPPGSSLRLPLPVLANLKSISLRLVYLLDPARRDGPDADNARDSIAFLIGNAPLLENLAIEPAEARPLNFDEMMNTPHWAQTSPFPLLKTIAATSITAPTSPNAANSLTRLTSLKFPNNLPDDASLWPALRSAGVKLQTIKVELPSTPLIDYIVGYRGLQVFHLGGRASDHANTLEWTHGQPHELLTRLLKSGLFEHRMTLRELKFCASKDPSGGVNWQGSPFTPSPEILRPAHRFRALERLDFVVEAKAWHMHIGMVLTPLPALSVRIKLVCFTVLGLDGTRYMDGQEHRDTLEAVVQPIEQLRFKMRPTNWKALRVIVKAFDPHHVHIAGIPFGVNRVAYRVEDGTGPDGTYGLIVDLLATELLNEESARFKDEDMIL